MEDVLEDLRLLFFLLRFLRSMIHDSGAHLSKHGLRRPEKLIVIRSLRTSFARVADPSGFEESAFREKSLRFQLRRSIGNAYLRMRSKTPCRVRG